MTHHHFYHVLLDKESHNVSPHPRGEETVSIFWWEKLQSEITKKCGWGKRKIEATNPPHQTLYSCCAPGSYDLFLLELLVPSSFGSTFQNDMRQTLWMLLLLCLIEMSLWSSLTKGRDGVVFFTGTHWRNLQVSVSMVVTLSATGASEQVWLLWSTLRIFVCAARNLSAKL